ncbi:uncharacterized protein LOC116166514 [Photinus pyralis]|uniref:uncharacterized protein LOC116166514 n=1 Tax=Photinus pyralis TaxID=7054 RepID=UPI0012674691|nr:uncharacterized protein LOC116166514 [Photinus pyralis]
MLVFFSIIPGYILLSSINAVLISRLATSRSNIPIRSIDDVLTVGFPMCLRTNSFVYNHFTRLRGAEKIVNRNWRGLLNGPGCKDINNQTNLAAILCNERIVILESRIVAASVVNDFHINCDIARVNRRYFVNGNAYLLRRGFYGKEAVETIIHLMRSTGLLRRLEDKWMKLDTRKNEQNQLSYVTIDHIKGLLYFYLIMIANSLIILGIEILVRRNFTKRDCLLKTQ